LVRQVFINSLKETWDLIRDRDHDAGFGKPLNDGPDYLARK
jgi:hypothetical protein